MTSATTLRICVVDDRHEQRQKILSMLRQVLQSYLGTDPEYIPEITQYDSALDLLPKITAAKGGAPFDFDVILADVYMPLDPDSKDDHPLGGAIRIYDAIKDAVLQDRVTLLIISIDISGAEHDLARIRVEQSALERQWATILWKPDALTGNPGAAGISRELWMAVVEKAIAHRGELTLAAPTGALEQDFFNAVKMKVETLAHQSRAAFVLITGDPGQPREEVARYFAAQLGKSTEEAKFTLRPNSVETIALRLFGRELPAPPQEGQLELHPDDLVILDEFCAQIANRGELDELLLGLLKSMSQPGRGGQFYRLKGIEPKAFNGTIALLCESFDALRKNPQLDPALASLVESRCVHVPALRERPTLIAPLARFLLKKEGSVKQFDKTALRVIREYPWPGNVRELEEKIKAIAKSVPAEWISAEDLRRAGIVTPPREPTGRRFLKRLREGWRLVRRPRRQLSWAFFAGLILFLAASIQGLDAAYDLGCRRGWWHYGCSPGSTAPPTPIAPSSGSITPGKDSAPSASRP